MMDKTGQWIIKWEGCCHHCGRYLPSSVSLPHLIVTG